MYLNREVCITKQAVGTFNLGIHLSISLEGGEKRVTPLLPLFSLRNVPRSESFHETVFSVRYELRLNEWLSIDHILQITAQPDGSTRDK